MRVSSTANTVYLELELELSTDDESIFEESRQRSLGRHGHVAGKEGPMKCRNARLILLPSNKIKELWWMYEAFIKKMK